MDDFARFVKRHAVRREKSRREGERERESIFSEEEEEDREEAEKKSAEHAEKAIVWRNVAWIGRENCVDPDGRRDETRPYHRGDRSYIPA